MDFFFDERMVNESQAIYSNAINDIRSVLFEKSSTEMQHRAQHQSKRKQNETKSKCNKVTNGNADILPKRLKN